MKEPSFDLESVYDSKIAPLMTEIIAICKEHRMPMIASFCYRNNEGEDGITSCATTNIPRLTPKGKVQFHPEGFQEAFKAIRKKPTALAFAFTISRTTQP